MMQYFTRPLNAFLIVPILCLLVFPGELSAWTAAQLFNIEVDVAVAKSGLSTVTTNARFLVEGGYFHGFDMVNLPGAKLDKTAGIATLDDKRTMPVVFKRIRDGRIRVLLDDNRFIRKGGITFRVVHYVDLHSTGALRNKNGYARLDFTPLVWDVGLDAMVLNIKLPKGGRFSPRVERSIAKDYIIDSDRDRITAIKYRPVKWYPMRLVVDFDPHLISSLATAEPGHQEYKSESTKPVVMPVNHKPSLHWQEKGLSVLFAFIGFIALIAKAKHIVEASTSSGATTDFALLGHTSMSIRIILAFIALVIGLVVQWAGYLAAAIPALCTTAAMFILRRQSVPTCPRSGGSWDPLSKTDLKHLTARLNEYRDAQRSVLDVTQGHGLAALGIYGVILGAVILILYKQNNQIAWTLLINGLVFAIPTWFGSIRSELPVNPLLEGFGTLKKWQRSLSKLLGTKLPGSNPVFYLRQDAKGPIEVRIKADSSIHGLRNIEVAAEIYRTGTIYRARTVFVLRLEPGVPIARKLAACKGAAEHHLTPDFQEEIIVLRNRRGRSLSQLTPLRTALSVMQG